MTLYAVLTGDVVDSRRLGAERLDAAFAQLADALEWFRPGGVVPWVGGLERFRGDGWQVCLSRPEMALGAAVYLRAGLRSSGVDARIGIGIGPVDKIDPGRLSASSGLAFTRSGRALDGLQPKHYLALDIGEGPLAECMAAVVLLLDVHLGRWTTRECLAVHARLRGLSHAQAACLPEARLRNGRAPSRPAISQALTRARWQTHVEPALQAASCALQSLGDHSHNPENWA